MSYIPTSAYEPGFPPAWEGLDYASADAAMPRLYAVSSGNGNDGVSHLYPDYYVRTCEPYRLAELAMVNTISSDYRAWAVEQCEVDGEAEYTISAVIYDPPDDDSDRDHSQCEDGEDCEGCEQCEGEGTSWSNANGAWIIVEVFPVDETNGRALAYTSLNDAFDADMLALIPAE